MSDALGFREDRGGADAIDRIIIEMHPGQPVECTRPVTAAEAGVDSARSIVMGAGYAAAFSWRACFQFQGRSSSIRLAG
jgi:hypothetical protein